MKIKHTIDGENFISKDCDSRNISLFMVNKSGSYFCMPANPDDLISNYSGYVSFEKEKMFKTLENIYVDMNGATIIPTEILNNCVFMERRYYGHLERFTLLRNGLIYDFETDSEENVGINVDLDFRDVNDYDDKGRIYKIHKSDNSIIVEYSKYSDDSLNTLVFQKYLVIHGIEDHYDLKDAWIHKKYSYDESRNSKSDFYVYSALRILCKKKCRLIFVHADNKADAFEKIADINHHNSLIEKTHDNYLNNELLLKHNICELTGEDIAFGYVNSVNAINGLMVESQNLKGVWAGLPWFFQYWSRDELISLKALILEEKKEFSKDVLLRHLNSIQSNGRIPNIYTAKGYSGLGSSDAIGWLFKRIQDVLVLIEQDGFKSYFNLFELKYIRERLEYSINQILLEHYKDGLVENGPLETWMDTNSENDFREGFRIEIQCAFLSMLKLINMLDHLLSNKFVKKDSKLISVPSFDSYSGKDYRALEIELSSRVKERFFIDGYLNDGWNCSNSIVSRPNVFLAYYFYPELLSIDEWESVFDKSIDRLWVEWDVGRKNGGGFSTIDLENPLYTPNYTGQNNKSYHRGDSWFFLNNLSAICMYSLNKEKYFSYIKKILNASTEDMLYRGFIGHSSEITSSGKLDSGGCFCQAWSLATYIELIHAMFM